VPAGPVTLPALHGVARCSIAQTEGPEAATRCLAGEIRAFTRAELGCGLEAALRAVTALAALTEAVLEVSAVRAVPPGVASPQALEELARELWGSGLAVRFGPSWTPALEADVCVGVGGDNHGLQAFLRSHPSWRVV
jgi:hypothetical protein